MSPLWRRPIWLLGHLVALAAVLTFVRLGTWQLERLDQKKDRNRVIAERSDGPPIDIAEVDPDAAAYQHVAASGRFDDAGEVRIRNRTYEGTTGFHVVTPFVLDDGRAAMINRGWVGLEDDIPPPPAGTLTIDGLLLSSQTRGSIGPKDPATGTLGTLNRVDVGRLQQQYDRDLLPEYVQLQSPVPAKGELPLPLPPPPRDEGPHLSYAIQWFLFASVVVVGYPLLMRRRSREPARTAAFVR